MKVLSRDPRAFWRMLRDVKEDQAIVLNWAGLRGLAAEVPDDPLPPPETELTEVVPKAHLLTFVKIIIALQKGRGVKLSPTPKTWKVCFGPAPKK